MNKMQFKSRKDASMFLAEKGIDTTNWTEVQWLKLNRGQAEIHMMALAEAIWDCQNESIPKQLQAGEWHIPFEDKINISVPMPDLGVLPVDEKEAVIYQKVKVSTAMAARTSYTVVGDEKEIGYDKLIGIHDRIVSAKPMHSSPMEHCARAMDDTEYDQFVKGVWDKPDFSDIKGWCYNYRGFIQYRYMLENQKL